MRMKAVDRIPSAVVFLGCWRSQEIPGIVVCRLFKVCECLGEERTVFSSPSLYRVKNTLVLLELLVSSQCWYASRALFLPEKVLAVHVTVPDTEIECLVIQVGLGGSQMLRMGLNRV